MTACGNRHSGAGPVFRADREPPLVSEITTNGVQASAGTGAPVRLLLVAGYHGVLVQVWDACSRMPVVPSVPDPLDAEHGRGLVLVEALSAAYGAYRPAGVGRRQSRLPRVLEGGTAVCVNDRG